MFQFSKIAVGGTFDRLHKGHEAILEKAFSVGEQVLIGVTSDPMAQRKPLPGLILSHADRVAELIAFLKSKGIFERAKIQSINNIYGTTRVDKTLTAIVVSKETEANARQINAMRKSRGLAELAIIIVDFVNDIDGKPIASQRIRAGVMDREGRVFASPKLALTPKTITDREREALRNPLGTLFSGQSREPLIAAKKVIASVKTSYPMAITVGDMTTESLMVASFTPDIVIVDLHVRRERKFDHVDQMPIPASFHRFRVHNPRGNISTELFETISQAIYYYIYKDMRSLVEVVGEEDLAVIPAVLAAPLGSLVIYGQPPLDFARGKPEEGLVVVEVTEEKKKEVVEILMRLSK